VEEFWVKVGTILLMIYSLCGFTVLHMNFGDFWMQ